MFETETRTQNHEEVLRVARDLFERNPDWVTFYREVLGLHGVVRQSYPTRQAMIDFEQSEAHDEVQRMLRKLRDRGADPEPTREPTRVITVRLPKSLHEALRVEAHEHQTSMNKLCVSKLLQFINENLVPGDA